MAPHLKGKISLNSKEARDAVRDLERSVNKFKKNVGAPLAKIGKMAAVAGLALAAMGTAAINSVAKAGDAMDKMSKRTGIATDELSRYAHAAALSGGSIDGMEKSLKAMGTALYEAKRGTKTYTDALGDLGLSFEDLANLDPGARFDLILTRLADIKDASLKSALALKVFGRNGIQLLPMLSGGAKGLKEMKAEADRLGIVFDADQAAAAARFVDETTRLKGSFRGLLIEGINLNSVSDSVAGLTSSMVALRESGATTAIMTGFVNLATNVVNAINHIVGGFNAMTDAERDAVRNAGIAFLGITVAFKSGLLIPITRGLALLVANFATAAGAINVVLAGIMTSIAAYDFAEALDKKFSFGARVSKKIFEAQKSIAEALGDDAGVLKFSRAIEEADRRILHQDAATEGDTFGEIFAERMRDRMKAILPDQFENLFSAGRKMFDFEIPDIAELTQSSKMAGDFAMTENAMANIAKMAEPIRGMMTGALRINHALSGSATGSEQRDQEKTQNSRDQVTEQKKTNELLQEVVEGIQERGSFSFAI
ncbi:hypothetical protein PDESU_03307 [Pontiella desulfatans]|uniref:Phage tail tape measure protein domain-containing protein n=1 Tax=Pontiella desulfatans TaxID=2750659 RepID=A0A6C2U3W2_PONDE|nr:hypothetical protein [Pontiella desulfatans]VGO14738.1 hypothetical protein PDESU_03307 [Pontiella desulfatans]